jgi:serine/threonine-protein kinase
MPGNEEAAAQRLASLKKELAPDLEVKRLLGTGRMAEVYLARQASLDRPVAVKVLSRQISRDDSARARFDREARAAASIESPYAVAVYRFGHLEDGVPYLIMQYVPGGTLEDRVHAEGPLPEAEAKQILANMAEALAAAHEHDFVHRDVRAANVLCDREKGRVLLSDFGLAGIRPDRQDTDARITQTGEIVGTPGYLSPEQLKGETATEATDVFALGLMGYEILTGTGPFAAPTQREAIIRALREPPTPLQTLRPGVDPRLAALLEQCLAKDPKKRPSARFLARAFLGEDEEATRSSRRPEQSAADGNVLESLLTRRLPQIVVVTAVVLYALLEFVQMLAEQNVVGNWAFEIMLNTFACGIAASGVIAWFHGKKGAQRVQPMEIALLAVVGIVWLALGALVFITP